ncbi:alpha/beta-hydrolase [Mollisia scopiformis]|uniref:Alpha/beta-hydrolase n=1 Tax=Mollisia scopiformis TaxID=149040 RepID=A0A194X9N7_MOLSC|nr:alpha/beta-hydrolase [Mollisia scopiformis]KUJ16900.1 alpha/beta-hydrolase [Mollisia scopiformis]
MTTHQTAKTQFVTSKDVKFAYRRFGNDTTNEVPLLFLIHFRGTMDFWDPLLVNSIATKRPVILFDNAGVGQSTGTVEDTIPKMAARVLDFLAALELKKVDVLGFSMGGHIAPYIYLNGPAGLVQHIIIAGSGPSAGEDIVVNSDERKKAIEVNAGAAQVERKNFEYLFFGPSESSQAAARAWWDRIHERNKSTSGEERSDLVSAGFADGGAGMMNMLKAFGVFANLELRAEGSYDRLGNIDIPVLIGQGKDDVMIPTVNSFVMQQKMPNAYLKIYPDSGHGFLYQFAEDFAQQVGWFLDTTAK